MTDLRKEVQDIIEAVGGNLSKAAAKVYAARRPLAMYVIEIGLNHVAAKSRASTRRNLRSAVVNPRFVQGAVTGSIRLSERSKQKLETAVADLFLEWKIGNTPLGDVTKEGLIAQATAERGSAKGHLRNAVLYEKLASPMSSGQKVRDYWREGKAIKLIRDEIWQDTETKDVSFTRSPDGPGASPPM